MTHASDFVYLDNNASTAIDVRVVKLMTSLLTADNCYGNPSTNHAFAVPAREVIDKARLQVAELFGCLSEEVIFTSGGTESSNHALQGIVMKEWCQRKKSEGKKMPAIHVVTTSIEHPCVLQALERLQEVVNCDVTFVEPTYEGGITPEAVRKAIRPGETVLISVMHANNETGMIQPIAEIGAIAREHNIMFHSDAAQTVGKLPTKVQELNVDLLSIAAHKFYGPKGVGALYVRKGVQLDNILFGGGQEFGRRPGTENAIAIAALGKACELSEAEFHKSRTNMKEARDYLETQLRLQVCQPLNIQLRINCDTSRCLPNTLNVSFRNVDGRKLVRKLRNHVALSTGSACHSGTTHVSNALMVSLDNDGLRKDFADGTIRFSTGKHTTCAEIDVAVQRIRETIEECYG